MPKPVKVYNKGIRPVVFKRDRTGIDAIHPGKFLTFNAKKANAIIAKFEHACIKEDYEKHLKEVAERQANVETETANKAKKETKAKSK